MRAVAILIVYREQLLNPNELTGTATKPRSTA
jgi:hypothetical protein